MGFNVSFVDAYLDILLPHFSCKLCHCKDSEKLIKVCILKIFGNQFRWKIKIYDHPPVVQKIPFDSVLPVFYSFFTCVSFERPSMSRSFSPRLIAIAGYSSRISRSSSFCSSMMLSSTNVFSALVPETPDVFTYLS